MKTKIKKHGFNIVNLSIVLLALSFYVSTVFGAGASQKKHEGVVPVLGTAETREDIGAEETEHICGLDSVVCPVGEVHSTGGVSPSGTRISPTSPAGKIDKEKKQIAQKLCDENGLGDFCWKDLIAMCIKESGCQPNTVGDQGRSYGFYQIQIRLHKISKDCAKNLSCSASWTLNHLIGHGYPTYRTYAIKRHNGSGTMAQIYAQAVKKISDNL